jgi:hypothetical protein
MSIFLDKKLLTGGILSFLVAGGGTTAFSLRNVKAEELKDMSADELAEHLSDGVDEIVNMVTPLVHESAQYIGELVRGIL